MITVLCFSAFSENSKTQTVTDGTGRTVALKNTPNRIVTLGAAATEILYEVGAQNQIAAVSSFSDYPEEAKNLPQIGGFDASSISLETIISYNPDLVIIYKGMHDVFIPTFDQLEIPYYISDVKDIEGVITEIKNIAILTGHKDKAASLEKKYRKTLKNLKVNVKSKAKVYYEVWNAPYMSCGKYSFINGIIEAAGAENIFGALEESYPVVSEEAILVSDPDFIILPASGYDSNVASRTGWDELKAVKNGKIIIVDDNIYNRAGPRVFEAIADLYKSLYTK